MLENKPSKLGNLLLEIGVLLMGSGANTHRIRMTINRIADCYNYKTDFLITHRTIILTLKDVEGNTAFTQLKQTNALVPNFRIVSGISRLSWNLVENKLPIQSVWEEINRLKSLPHYPRFVVLLVVAFACSSFCRLSGGEFLDMGIVFISSFSGLFLKQEMAKKKTNPYIGVFLASFFTSLVSGGIVFFMSSNQQSIILVTSILYLIPGIPLINSITDILDGYSLNGMIRGINGTVISFAIAAGLLLAMLIFKTF
ncbi:threonine/serine exporter family protein [Flavobacteriaceae bacterium SZ-1-7]|uniref:threonine/serine ThrE exporter family protein n=1 Tax=Tamlana sedimenti TaxID=3134126 RepID=UPI003121C59C